MRKKCAFEDYNKVRVVLSVQNLSILSLLLSLCSVFAFGVNSFHILRFCADESELTLINKAKQHREQKTDLFLLLCSFRSLPRAICELSSSMMVVLGFWEFCKCSPRPRTDWDLRADQSYSCQLPEDGLGRATVASRWPSLVWRSIFCHAAEKSSRPGWNRSTAVVCLCWAWNSLSSWDRSHCASRCSSRGVLRRLSGSLDVRDLAWTSRFWAGRVVPFSQLSCRRLASFDVLWLA